MGADPLVGQSPALVPGATAAGAQHPFEARTRRPASILGAPGDAFAAPRAASGESISPGSTTCRMATQAHWRTTFPLDRQRSSCWTRAPCGYATGASDRCSAKANGVLLEEWLRRVKDTYPVKFIVTSCALLYRMILDIPRDRWSGFPREQDRLLRFLGENGIENVYLLAGDSAFCPRNPRPSERSRWAKNTPVGVLLNAIRAATQYPLQPNLLANTRGSGPQSECGVQGREAQLRSGAGELRRVRLTFGAI